MRKLLVVGVVVALLCLAGARYWRRAPADDLVATENERARSTIGSVTRPPANARSPRRRPQPNARPPFFAANTAETEQEQPGEEAVKAPAPAYRARDRYYDRLLLQQGRDHAKEEQLLSRVMTVFGDSPDTLVGAIACSPEFCRIDLRGAGEVDVNKRWQADLFSAVEPKGLKFFVVANDDDGDTLTTFYFGRDMSWTVPDFHALGMLYTGP
jgi:hypothetical protein